MDTDNIRALLEVCEPASVAQRPTNPQAATPDELDQMEGYYQMMYANAHCTCAGFHHIFTDRMCPFTWLCSTAEVQ